MELHRSAGLERRFLLALTLTGLIFIIEVVGGIWTGSLALVSDAAHVLLDMVAIGLSYLALRLATLPPDDRHTFGYHRLEVLAALANGITLVAVSLAILAEAYQRWVRPVAIRSAEMLLIAAVGLGANLAVAFLLANRGERAQGRREDLNVRSAYLHAATDAISSVGVIGAGAVIYFTGWQQADPLASAAIGILILFSAGRVLRSSLHILVEGVPEGLSLGQVGDVMSTTPGVSGVHDLHVWSLCSNQVALSAHVVPAEVSPEEQRAVLLELRRRLEEGFGIRHTTLQFEGASCGQGTPVEQSAPSSAPAK